MTTAGVADYFAGNRIFLCCESERGKGGQLDLVWRSHVCGKTLGAKFEGDVQEAERPAGSISSWRVRVLARS